LGVTGNETITTGTTTTKITSNLIVAVGSSGDNALYGIVQTVHPVANTGGINGGAQWSYSMIQAGQRVYGMGLVPNANGRIIIGMGGNATGTNGLTIDCDNTRLGIGQMNPAYALDVNGVARSYSCNTGGVADGSNIVWGGGSNTASNTATYSLQTQGGGGGTVHQRIQSRYDGGQYGLSIDSVGNSVSNLLRIVDGGSTGSGVGIGTATVAGGAYALQVAGGLTVDKGFRPSYSKITSGTSITASSNYGTHYDIQTSAITGLTISYPAAGSNNWSNDSNGYWVFRNNTGTYLSLAITYTAATPNIYPSNVTIPPANSVTLMASYPGGGTNSNYVLF
jgi:hypothetical protein